MHLKHWRVNKNKATLSELMASWAGFWHVALGDPSTFPNPDSLSLQLYYLNQCFSSGGSRPTKQNKNILLNVLIMQDFYFESVKAVYSSVRHIHVCNECLRKIVTLSWFSTCCQMRCYQAICQDNFSSIIFVTCYKIKSLSPQKNKLSWPVNH